MISKKLLAMIMVAVMVVCPLAVAYGSSNVEGADTQDAIGTSVEVKDFTYDELKTVVNTYEKDLLKDAYDFNGSKYSKYVIMALFPGANSSVFEQKIHVDIKDTDKMSISVKADIYNSAVKGKEMTQKVALSISIKNINLEFSGLKIEADKTPIFNQTDLTSIFVDGDYAKYISDSKLLNYKTAGDVVKATGSLNLKVYLQTDVKATTVEDEQYITEGGVQVPFVFLLSKYVDIGPISDARVKLSSDITVDIINGESKNVYQTSVFKSDVKIVAKAYLEYAYNADYTNVALKSKELKAFVSESASIDGKSNNALDIDLTSNLKALIDGRAGPVYADMCIFDGEIAVNKYFDIREIAFPVAPESNDGAMINLEQIIYLIDETAVIEHDAAKVNSDATSIKNSISNDNPSDDMTMIIVAIIVVLVILIALVCYFYKKRQKV